MWPTSLPRRKKETKASSCNSQMSDTTCVACQAHYFGGSKIMEVKEGMQRGQLCGAVRCSEGAAARPPHCRAPGTTFPSTLHVHVPVGSGGRGLGCSIWEAAEKGRRSLSEATSRPSAADARRGHGRPSCAPTAFPREDARWLVSSLATPRYLAGAVARLRCDDFSTQSTTMGGHRPRDSGSDSG